MLIFFYGWVDEIITGLIITSDFARSNPGRDIGTLIGSTSKSKTLFKNKCFLLTCTVTPFKGSEVSLVTEEELHKLSSYFLGLIFLIPRTYLIMSVT